MTQNYKIPRYNCSEKEKQQIEADMELYERDIDRFKENVYNN